MRRPCNLGTAPTIEPELSWPVLADLRLQVVTPMFGGGVDVGVNDPDHLIRAPAIRGHLRYWWRACNASRFATLAELHEAERRLWGSAAKANDPGYGPGTLQLRVLDTDGKNAPEVYYKAQKPDRGWHIRDNQMLPARLDYALFPFTPNQNQQARSGKIGVSFRLQVGLASHTGTGTWPSEAESAAAARQALWAWIVFGGIGARTRRGCGTLRCIGDGDKGARLADEHRIPASEFQVNPSEPAEWLQGGLAACLGPGPYHMTAVPSFHGHRLLIGAKSVGVIDAWNAAITPLQRFVQGSGIGRNPGANGSMKLGQSYWPEVGAARGLIGFPARLDAHSKSYTQLPIPRADLGLPRVIKLASGRDDPQVTLERNETGFSRMASPLILKALPISSDKAIPIALLLNAPHIWDNASPGLVLIDGTTRHPLTPLALNAHGGTPTWPRTRPQHVDDRGIDSVREAFLRYVADQDGWDNVV